VHIGATWRIRTETSLSGGGAASCQIASVTRC